MLPNRRVLRGWNPASLTASAVTITSKAGSVADAVARMDDTCRRMPETRTWSGRSHDAAEAMFARADRHASALLDYATSLASALAEGGEAIGSARTALLAKADRVDAGPLTVTDEWVVLVDAVRMPQDRLAELAALARSEQQSINRLLTAVGDADDATAEAMLAAGNAHGLAESGPAAEIGSLILPAAQRPGDQVPDPRDPIGVVAQEAIRRAHEATAVVDVSEPVENEYGDDVTAVTMQDGSRSELTVYDPFDWPSKQGFASIVQYDADGNEVSRTDSWHDLGNACAYTTVSWPDRSTYTMSLKPDGTRHAGFATADGRHSTVPVELIDQMSLAAGSALSGLEKHIARGGSLPMVTPSSIDDVGRATRFGGPALTVATTVFDMVMADSTHDACVALVAGAAGFGGGWAGAQLGATIAAPMPAAVSWAAGGGAAVLGYFGAELGKLVGDVVCPY